MDVEAAHSLLADNHPAAVPAVGDTAFRSALRAAYARAVARAARVTNYEGYVATLGEFAGSMGDAHIWSNRRIVKYTVRWAGLIAARRGPNWVVARGDAKVAGEDFIGARIVSCDGQAADAWARQVLRFRTDASVAAERAIQGSWLLIDEGNPFLRRPSACILERNGKRIRLPLRWTEIARDTLIQRFWSHAKGQAGFGLRRSGAGYWIALEGLTPPAQPVIDAVRAQRRGIRRAPYAVVDLRGNGGGDDGYGRALAEALYGADHVAAILGPRSDAGGSCHPAFRASPGNIAGMTAGADEFRKQGNPRAARNYTAAVRSMKAALARGRALAGRLTCPARAAAALPRRAPSLLRGKLFVLTDARCFSSCLGTVHFFRKLGAIQVGQETSANTHYSEVREIVLPSGLSAFSTLQGIMPDMPRRIGPFAPRHLYTGDIADTAALERWVGQTLAR